MGIRVLCEGAYSQHSPSRPELRVPIWISQQSGCLFVQAVQRKGDRGALFLLDTGLPHPLMLSPEGVAILNLPSRRAGHKKDVSLLTTTIDSFYLPGENDMALAVGQIEAIVDPTLTAVLQHAAPDIAPVAGAIGLPLLKDMPAVTMDFSTKHLIYHIDNPPSLPPHAAVLPMELERAGGDGDGYKAYVSLWGYRSVVDTGASLTCVPPQTALRAKCVQLRWIEVLSLYTEQLSTEACVERLAIPPFIEPRVHVTYHCENYILLGMSLLRRFRVTMDFAKSRLILERSADYEEQVPPSGWSGIERLELQSGTICIASIKSDSPAYRAGVRAGDVLLQVDTHPVKGLSIEKVARLVDGTAGSRVCLGLQRQGGGKPRRLQVAFVRDSACTPSRQVDFYGCVLSREEKGVPLLVCGITKGTPAYRCGLREGDEVYRINNVRVQESTLPEVMKELEKSKVRMEIRRWGLPLFVQFDASIHHKGAQPTQ